MASQQEAQSRPSSQQQTTPEKQTPSSSASPEQNSDHDEEEKQFGSTGGEPQQTRRILGIVPNFQSVTADQTLPPETAKQKFRIAARNSFDYSSFLLAGVQAGFAMDSKSYPEFRQGAIGYFRYYWHTMADTADENFMVSGVAPIAFREDSRFYTLGHGSVGHRAAYAWSRIFITRTDSGNETFNVSEIVGAGAASEVSSLYYPERYHTWTKVGQKWLTSVLIDSGNFTFKEFWPSINRKFFHEH